MNIKTTIGRVLGIEPDTRHGESNRAGLSLPSLDDRAAIYLRAIHGNRDFSEEEFAKARSIILAAMSDDIGLRSKESPMAPIGESHIGAVDEGVRLAPAPLAMERLSMVVAAQVELPMLKSMHEFAQAPIARSVSDREAKSASRPPKRRVLGLSALAAVLAAIAVIPTVLLVNDSSHQRQAVMTEVSSTLGGSTGLGLSGSTGLPPSSLTPAKPRPIDSDEVKRLTRAAPANVAPPAESSASVSNQLLERGRQLLVARNIEESRSVLKQAVEMGNASAAFLLGATYDPLEIKALGIEQSETKAVGIEPVKSKALVIKDASPDIGLAKYWYEKAKELGSTDAVKRLERLSSLPR